MMLSARWLSSHRVRATGRITMVVVACALLTLGLNALAQEPGGEPPADEPEAKQLTDESGAQALVDDPEAEQLTDKPEEKPSASEMVLIPGGEFQMGSDTEGDHKPAHTVRVDSFYIDRTEVTNAQYHIFCQETERTLPFFWGMDRFRCGLEYPEHPVVGVSWSDAKAYAEWCGKRLPTEAEWEYAARGGLVGKDFPLGDELPASDANHRRSGQDGTVAVGSYAPNGFGLHDMAGNVVEWVWDWYAADYYSKSPAENPKGPEDGGFKVIRGGGWFSGPSCNRVFHRNALPPNWVDFAVGFRCARDHAQQ